MADDLRLECWFLHEELVLNLLTENEATALARAIPEPGRSLAQVLRVDLFQRAISRYLVTTGVASLEVLHLKGALNSGMLVWLEQEISFKGVADARAKVERGLSGRASFTARLATDRSVRVVGDYSASRLTSGSSTDQLSRTKRQFLLGYVESLMVDEIRVRPIVIASRWFQSKYRTGSYLPIISNDPWHVWPLSIDQFDGVDFTRSLKSSDLLLLKEVPEEAVKNFFADIIGEPDVPKDWGGEQFDLWSSMVSIEGNRLRTAFAFKGPAKFRPMTIADLGKNGDQIDRLAQTAADLIVVQHCHSIRAPVINMLKAYAGDPMRPRRYMTIDGYDTIRILRHFGKI
ncbi:hypothetical protein ABZ345_36085 [Lentzea sp. NPDC005914]|uniref:hypothetical protein n=1 Tax=Lentzea sp. NPDC005914 TaxID=3154572 RepID=UPI0034097AAD